MAQNQIDLGHRQQLLGPLLLVIVGQALIFGAPVHADHDEVCLGVSLARFAAALMTAGSIWFAIHSLPLGRFTPKP